MLTILTIAAGTVLGGFLCHRLGYRQGVKSVPQPSRTNRASRTYDDQDKFLADFRDGKPVK